MNQHLPSHLLQSQDGSRYNVYVIMSLILLIIICYILWSEAQSQCLPPILLPAEVEEVIDGRGMSPLHYHSSVTVEESLLDCITWRRAIVISIVVVISILLITGKTEQILCYPDSDYRLRIALLLLLLFIIFTLSEIILIMRIHNGINNQSAQSL